MKRGRKKKSGVLSGIDPERESWTEIRNRIICGSGEWRIIRLRQLIGDRAKLPDNYLRARAADYHAKPTELVALWREFAGECERAVLDGDADWFRRQAKAIEKGGLPQRAQFYAKVIDLFEAATFTHGRRKWRRLNEKEWGVVSHPQFPRPVSVTRANRLRRCDESLLLTPAGQLTDAKVGKIYAALDKHEVQSADLSSHIKDPEQRKAYQQGKEAKSSLLVEGAQFESKERVMEAIRDLAKQLQLALNLRPRLRRKKRAPRTGNP